MGDTPLVAAVEAVGVEGSGVKLGEVFGFEVNDAADHIGSGGNGAEIAIDPVRGDCGVCVGGEYGGVGTMFQAMEGCVHQETAGGADVRFLGRQGTLGEVQGEGGVLSLEGANGLDRGVRAVVEENDDLVYGMVQRCAARVGLEAESFQRGGKSLLLVACRDDDGGAPGHWLASCVAGPSPRPSPV